MENRGAFEEEIGRKRLRGVPFRAIAIIEGLQPYNDGEDPQRSPLFALKTFTNIHKHRNLLITTLGARPAPADASIVEVDGKGYVFSQSSFEIPFDLDAEFGPFTIEGSDVHMKEKYGSVVVLAETPYKGREICSFVGWMCLYLRDTLIPMFDDLFA